MPRNLFLIKYSERNNESRSLRFGIKIPVIIRIQFISTHDRHLFPSWLFVPLFWAKNEQIYSDIICRYVNYFRSFSHLCFNVSGACVCERTLMLEFSKYLWNSRAKISLYLLLGGLKTLRKKVFLEIQNSLLIFHF